MITLPPQNMFSVFLASLLPSIYILTTFLLLQIHSLSILNPFCLHFLCFLFLPFLNHYHSTKEHRFIWGEARRKEYAGANARKTIQIPSGEIG
jgi:hypothetical protein